MKFESTDEAQMRALFAYLGLSQETIDAAVEARKAASPKPDHLILANRLKKAQQSAS